MPKTVVCDSSSLISLSQTCTANVVEFLRKKTGVRFVAPPSVYAESVAKPSGITKFAASALRIKRLFGQKSISIDGADIALDTQRILEAGNRLFSVGGRPLELLHLGESECLALAKKTPGARLLVDEKTLRMLLEAPDKMQAILQTEYRERLAADPARMRAWKSLCADIPLIRSTEVLSVAYEKGYYNDYGTDASAAWQAGLAALKNAGCSVTFKEMDEYRRLSNA